MTRPSELPDDSILVTEYQPRSLLERPPPPQPDHDLVLDGKGCAVMVMLAMPSERLVYTTSPLFLSMSRAGALAGAMTQCGH
jgi:hypothetical protein